MCEVILTVGVIGVLTAILVYFPVDLDTDVPDF